MTPTRDPEARDGRTDDMTEMRGVTSEDFGQLSRRDGRLVIEFTRRLRHSPETVWRALTEPDHLAAWFPTTIDGERAAGAPLRFAFRDMEAEPFDGEMLAFEPPSLMEFRWGDDILRFEVRPDGDGSVLSLTDRVEEAGKAARDGAGWHAKLDLLAYEVDGGKPPWHEVDHWRELWAAYIERFGPEASTIGPPEEWERVHGAATREAG
jgi:uncharacterized protein YndB with AHSA1/START domain